MNDRARSHAIRVSEIGFACPGEEGALIGIGIEIGIQFGSTVERRGVTGGSNGVMSLMTENSSFFSMRCVNCKVINRFCLLVVFHHSYVTVGYCNI